MGKRSFSTELRVEMRRQNLSVRKLGKLVDPVDPERGRRRVQRHLSGTSPSRANRATYAQVLDAPQLAEKEPEPVFDLLKAIRTIGRELERAT